MIKHFVFIADGNNIAGEDFIDSDSLTNYYLELIETYKVVLKRYPKVLRVVEGAGPFRDIYPSPAFLRWFYADTKEEVFKEKARLGEGPNGKPV